MAERWGGMQGMQVAAEPLSAPPYATECAMTLDGTDLTLWHWNIIFFPSGHAIMRAVENPVIIFRRIFTFLINAPHKEVG